jgi:hypothetical protein
MSYDMLCPVMPKLYQPVGWLCYGIPHNSNETLMRHYETLMPKLYPVYDIL